MATSPESQRLYEQLLVALKPLGLFGIEEKKTCIHLVRGSAFAGVHFRKRHLLITVKAAGPIANTRIAKSEQVSKNRWHHDLKLTDGAEIDAELIAWLRASYELAAIPSVNQ